MNDQDTSTEIVGESLSALLIAAKSIIEATASKATRQAYRSDCKQFGDWCQQHGLPAYPTNTDTVCLYMTHMNEIGRKPSTIRRALTSIKQIHIKSDYPDPIDWRCLDMMRGISRIRGTARNKRKPITLDILRRVIDQTPNDFIGIRDKALLLTGWTGALRRSEIAAIRCEDIEERDQGLLLTIRRSKTDQEGKGRKIGLPFIDSERSLCAPRAIANWKRASFIESGALFRAVGRWGVDRRQIAWIKKRELTGPINAKSVYKIVKSAVQRAGYDAQSFGAHSLRSGLATTLAEYGIQERSIMAITGHKSLPMLREYIESGQIFRDHPVAAIFRKD